MSEKLRIATRKSRLALWQAEHVQERLQTEWQVPVELVPLSTRGDEILDRSLSKVGGKGLFVKELELALEQHELVKVKVAAEDRETRDAWIGELAEKSEAALVSRIGHTAVLYRRSKDKPLVILPRG